MIDNSGKFTDLLNLKKSSKGFTDTSGCGCSGNNSASGISRGGNPNPQAPYCSQSPPSTGCSSDNGGNCYQDGNGVNCECSNVTGSWCWTVNANCSKVVHPLFFFSPTQ